jgi:hypothetical protein
MREAVSGRQVPPVHPLLFGAFPLLALYARNAGEVPIHQLIRPLGLALAGTVVLWVVFTLLTRNVRKAAMSASAVVLAFFSYGHVLNVLPAPLRGLGLPACAIGLVVLLAAIFRSRQPLYDVTKVLNAAAVILIAPSAWTVGVTLFSAPHASASFPQPMETASPRSVQAVRAAGRSRLIAKAKGELPDVYYIILDAYGGADSLKMFYGHDNAPFLRALEGRGFYIPRNSHANYNQTPLCLASSLNLTYIDNLTNQLGPASRDVEPARQMLDDNVVARHLAKFGYRYVHVSSGAGQTRVQTADLVLNDRAQMSNFEGHAIGLTALDAAPLSEKARYREHREQLLGGFRELDSVAQLPYRKFVFAHILAPHPPFVLGANGEAVDPKGPLSFADGSWLVPGMPKDEYRSRYIAQMSYVNRRVLEAVDAILRQSKRPPIIILQGDHGARMHLDWESHEKTDVRETYSILNAYLVPQKVRDCLYDGITPVNTFRILLSSLYGAKYKKLPDRSYYSPAEHPYAFVDVTRRTALAEKPGVLQGAGAESVPLGRSGKQRSRGEMLVPEAIPKSAVP